MPLTLDEIKALQTGDRVRVTWSGGNGPHEYAIKREDGGAICCCTPTLPDGVGWLFDPLRDRNAIVSINRVERVG